MKYINYSSFGSKYQGTGSVLFDEKNLWFRNKYQAKTYNLRMIIYSIRVYFFICENWFFKQIK